MSELPEGVVPAEPPPPVPSASGIVACAAAGGRWRLLLGLRSRRTRFLPGHLAFPGGRLEPADEPEREGAFERCVAREMAEETGLALAPEAWIAAGERTTPPMFPLRFHTRFYVAEAPPGWRPPEEPPAPGEVEKLETLDPSDAVADWSAGRAQVPPPVLAILRALAGESDPTPHALAARVALANAVEERAPRIEFLPDVWVLPVRTATLPPASHTNVWLAGGRRFVVVDPGSAEPQEQQRLLDVVARRRALGQAVEAVLLTHGHRDHTAGAVALARALGVPLRAHPDVLDGLGESTSGLPCEPLEDGDRLDLDGLALHVLHTPGHARGHLAFHFPERSALIAGDLVSGNSTILVVPGDGDMEQYLASLERVAALGCATLLPGHGPPLPGAALSQLVAHRRARESAVVAQLAEQPVDLATIATGAYADTPGLPWKLVEGQTLSHLLWLERRGVAARGDGEGRSWSRGSTIEGEATR